MDKEYDKIIDMLCLTGKMPLAMIESVCNYARKSINNALVIADGDRQSRAENRNNILFGDIVRFKNDYRSAWYDYENEYADNFSVD